MKTIVTTAIVLGSIFAATAASAEPRTSFFFDDKPSWAQDAFLGGTQR